MAQSSPSVSRVTSVLNFLARHPREDFSLSELARRLDLSPATAHALLNALVDEGYLMRQPETKKFALGPALIQLGAAAAARQEDVLEYARPELRRLGEQVGHQCAATSVIDNQIVILAREGHLGPMGAMVQVGQRLPFVPPLGTLFVAWSDREVVEGWLRKMEPRTGERALKKCLEAVETIRRSGYLVGLNLDAPHRRLYAEGDVAAPLRGRPGARVASGLTKLLESGYILGEIVPERSYMVRQVAAPVFDVDQKVVLALSILYFGESCTGEKLRRDVGEVVAAADRVTKTIHGRRPPVDLP